MKLLEERIQKEGKILPGNIVKVDGFLNHRVDVKLMREMAKEFGRLFDLDGITAVLTIEASGIALAAICAEEFGVPMVFAKKAKSDKLLAIKSKRIISNDGNLKWISPTINTNLYTLLQFLP